MEKLYDLFNNKASLYAANRPSYSPNVLKYSARIFVNCPVPHPISAPSAVEENPKSFCKYFNTLGE